MLQISQIEKPRCSATIDQMRLRCAMALPVVFQNTSSSGFHSAIQVEFGAELAVLIGCGSFSARLDPLGGTPNRERSRKPCAKDYR